MLYNKPNQLLSSSCSSPKRPVNNIETIRNFYVEDPWLQTSKRIWHWHLRCWSFPDAITEPHFLNLFDMIFSVPVKIWILSRFKGRKFLAFQFARLSGRRHHQMQTRCAKGRHFCGKKVTQDSKLFGFFGGFWISLNMTHLQNLSKPLLVLLQVAHLAQFCRKITGSHTPPAPTEPPRASIPAPWQWRQWRFSSWPLATWKVIWYDLIIKQYYGTLWTQHLFNWFMLKTKRQNTSKYRPVSFDWLATFFNPALFFRTVVR